MTPNKKIFGVHISDFCPESREYAETFECVFCKIVSKDNLILYCSHCICENCISKGIQFEKCPVDNEDIVKKITAFNTNEIAKALLDNLKIRCIFHKNGCRWSGLFKDFEDKHLPKCDYKDKLNENSIINNDEEENNIKNINSYENESNSLNDNKKENLDNKNNNEYIDDDDISIISGDENISDKNENKNDLLNKKRNNSQEIDILNEIKDYKDYKDYIEINENKNNIYEQSFNFDKDNNIFNNEILLPEESSDENKYIIINYDKASSNENIEIMNNNIIINSELTSNIFPYHYYFTEPLYYTFTSLIKSISRNILRNNSEISFGLTNLDNYEYLEILSTQKYENLFFKDDIIRISYDNDLFLIYFENNKKNHILIPFKNNEEIKYYPTIILNDEQDILEVSHN